MKKFVSLFLTLCVLLSLAIPVLGESIPATFLYVATDGDDTAAGTIDAPFQTLQAAINASRAIEGTVVINMRGGTYQVTETITLTEEDHDLVIRAYQDEKVILTGGTELSLADFKPCEDTAFLDALIDQSVRENIICANILELGVTDMGEIELSISGEGALDQNMNYTSSLSFGGNLLTIACYPNEGYMHIKEVLRDGTDPEDAHPEGIWAALIQFTVDDENERLNKWNWKDVCSHGYYEFDYTPSSAPAQYDFETAVVTTYGARPYNNYPAVSSQRRVKFFNVREELDAPGEWYLDRQTGMLYLIPTEEMTADSQLLFTSSKQDLVNISDAERVTFVGFTLTGTTNIALYAENCSDLTIDDCDISITGRAAVYFYNCYRSGVQNSYLHDLDGAGLILDHCGERVTLTSSECFVTNCHFERFTQYAGAYAPAIHPTNTIGVVISHCQFNDAPHSAIVTVGSSDPSMELTIEYCEFYDVCNDTADCGVFYTSRHWENLGNVIRYNYFHDISPLADEYTEYSSNVIYLDEVVSGAYVFGNVFYKTTKPLCLAGGRNVTFSNNLMLDCWSRISTDDRGINRTPEQNAAVLNEHTASLEEVPYKEGIWAEKYPELVNILEDQPAYPKYNTITNNVTYMGFIHLDAAVISTGVKMFGTVKNNIDITSTEGFVDYANQDFTLKEDSEIFTLIPDFEPIPFNEIGLYDYTVDDVYAEVQ